MVWMIWDFVSTFAMSVSFFTRARAATNHPQIRSQTLKTKISGRNKKRQKPRKKSAVRFSCTARAIHATEERCESRDLALLRIDTYQCHPMRIRVYGRSVAAAES